MPGFSDTAAFFEVRAKKARSPDRQSELAHTASFYRALAQITPTFPSGYKPPADIKPNGSRNADRLRKWAEECRAIAASMRDANCKAMLERLAQTYEQTAASYTKFERSA